MDLVQIIATVVAAAIIFLPVWGCMAYIGVAGFIKWKDARKEAREEKKILVLDYGNEHFCLVGISNLDWFDLEDYYEELCDERELLASLTAEGQERSQDLHTVYHKLAFIEDEMKRRIG